MKRFFGRFSTAGGGTGPSEKGLDGSSSAFSPRDRVGSGDRVKALAAKWEGLNEASPAPVNAVSAPATVRRPRKTAPAETSRGEAPQPAQAHAELAASSRVAAAGQPSPSAPPAATPESQSSARSPPEAPREASGGRDAEAAAVKRQGVLGLGIGLGHLEAPRDDAGSRDASGSSTGGKSVAFAPSPKKAVRSSSPPRHAASDELPVSNFAKPTLASAARARIVSKPSSSDGIGASSSATTLSTPGAKGPSTAGPQRPRRTNSTSGRRGTPGEPDGTPDISRPSIAHAAASSTHSLSHDGLPNSIPFVSAHSGLGTYRTGSPLSLSGSGAPASRRGSGFMRHAADGPSWTSAGHSVAGPSWASDGAGSGARSFGAPSWSEMTEGDLVSNLGPRERTRQEVLWEIVASEERYVAELEKTKELYLDALLHPLRFSPSTSPHPPAAPSTAPNETPSRGRLSAAASAAAGSSSDLPIASRFMSTAGSSDGHSTPNAAALAQAQAQLDAGPHSPYAAGMGHSSAPHSRRASVVHARPSASRTSLAQGLGIGSTARNPPQKPAPSASTRPNAKRWSSRAASQVGYADTGLSVPLPASLRIVLESLFDGLLEGHALLSEALKARYEEQYPLVRSLADVFLKYQYILKHYALYVCHLERALDELEEASLMERAMRGKRIKRERLTQTVGLGRAVASLEAAAAERGECGLSIFLSMPFQRLLKYPLLFQNLLFHTDPSMYEFENTVGMVVDVERIVRSIEDEKTNSEERDRLRDAFARIDGITDRQVLRPRADRLLIEEYALYDESPRRALSESAPIEGRNSSDSAPNVRGTGAAASATPGLRAAIKSKRSYRRLSDYLTNDTATKTPNMGSKRDVWIVRFSDVELRCQRVGVTALPMASSAVLTAPDADSKAGAAPAAGDSTATPDDSESAGDFAARSKESKERLKALRNTTLRAKTRNLYKFVGVVAWRKAQAADGADDVDPNSLLEADGDECEEDDDASSNASEETEAGVLLDTERYVRQSTLSFSYTGDSVLPRPVPIRASTSVSQHGHSPSVTAFRASRSAASVNRGIGRNGSPKPRPAQESEASVVSQSHAQPRRDKFGARLRSEQLQQAGPGGAAWTSYGTASSASSHQAQRRLSSRMQALPGSGAPSSSSHDAVSAHRAAASSSEDAAAARPPLTRDLSSVNSDMQLASRLMDL